MANKRELKKAINYVASDLFLECIVLKQIKKADPAAADAILGDILHLQNEEATSAKSYSVSYEQYLAVEITPEYFYSLQYQ